MVCCGDVLFLIQNESKRPPKLCRQETPNSVCVRIMYDDVEDDDEDEDDDDDDEEEDDDDDYNDEEEENGVDYDLIPTEDDSEL